jgi:hypothetical protein
LVSDTSILHRQVPLFEEQNDALYFVMGIAHLASLYLQVVDGVVSEQRVDGRAAEPQDAEVESLLFFLLGLRSFSSRLLALVADFEPRPDVTGARGQQVSAEPIAPRQLLR